MRFLFKISWPVEAGNAAAKEGFKAIPRILEEQKPESVYFIAEGGIVIADIGNLRQAEDTSTPPDFVHEVNNSTLRFFFASVHRDDS